MSCSRVMSQFITHHVLADVPAIKDFFEGRETVIHSGFDGVDGHFECFGYFGEFESLIFFHDDDDALFFGQVLQCAVEQVPNALFVNYRVWGRCCVCYGGVECVQGDEGATAACVSAGVERDLIDPRGEFVGVAQTPHAFVRANKGLLTQIARVVSIARIAQDKVVDRALPAFDEGIKGRDLPGSELGDQFRIVHTVDLFWRFM